MSLLFGNLTQAFVTFGTTQNNYYQNINDTAAYQELQTAAAQFRHDASLDALYLDRKSVV